MFESFSLTKKRQSKFTKLRGRPEFAQLDKINLDLPKRRCDFQDTTVIIQLAHGKMNYFSTYKEEVKQAIPRSPLDPRSEFSSPGRFPLSPAST